MDDNFFDLGGHSLLLVQRARAAREDRLRPDLPVVALLQYPTVRSLARHLSGAGDTANGAAVAREDGVNKQREALARRAISTGEGDNPCPTPTPTTLTTDRDRRAGRPLSGSAQCR